MLKIKIFQEFRKNYLKKELYFVAVPTCTSMYISLSHLGSGGQKSWSYFVEEINIMLAK